MAVRLLLTSGKRRVLSEADGARLDGAFFLITRLTGTSREAVVLTVRSADVFGAEIVTDGELIDYVPGTGQTS